MGQLAERGGLMDKMFSFSPRVISDACYASDVADAPQGFLVEALCAIAERLEAIHEEMVEAKKERRA